MFLAARKLHFVSDGGRLGSLRQAFWASQDSKRPPPAMSGKTAFFRGGAGHILAYGSDRRPVKLPKLDQIRGPFGRNRPERKKKKELKRERERERERDRER